MAMVLFEVIGAMVIPKIEMPVSATIVDLKKRIKMVLDVDVARQTLKFNDLLLLDGQTISNYNFGRRAIVVLYVKPLDGQPKFNILIRFGEKYLGFKVRETALVSELKRKIGNRWGVCGNEVTLYRLSEKMYDECPLSAYYVSEDSIVDATCSSKEFSLDF